MRGTLASTALFALLLAVSSTSAAAGSLRHIDASSDAGAEASYKAMMAGLPNSKKLQLAMAITALNLAGVNSAYEYLRRPELQSPTVTRVKDRVAGLSADEIIALAAETSEVRFEVVEQPG